MCRDFSLVKRPKKKPASSNFHAHLVSNDIKRKQIFIRVHTHLFGGTMLTKFDKLTDQRLFNFSAPILRKIIADGHIHI
jgi:hypothetical protein